MSNFIPKKLQCHLFATIHKIPGFCNMTCNDWESIDTLIEKIQHPQLQLCEIGSNTGHSTCLLGLWAQHLNGKLVTMDPMQYDNAPAVYECLQINLKYYNLLPHVECIKDFSYNVVSRFLDESFDFIFIDGNHEYLPVKQDITLYYPKLKPGGIMCGHDYEIHATQDGMANITQVPIFKQLFLEGNRILYGQDTKIKVNEDGSFDLRKISNWDTRDIIGLAFNVTDYAPRFGVHPGVVLAVTEIFGEKVNKIGDRVWWIEKP